LAKVTGERDGLRRACDRLGAEVDALRPRMAAAEARAVELTAAQRSLLERVSTLQAALLDSRQRRSALSDGLARLDRLLLGDPCSDDDEGVADGVDESPLSFKTLALKVRALRQDLARSASEAAAAAAEGKRLARALAEAEADRSAALHLARDAAAQAASGPNEDLGKVRRALAAAEAERDDATGEAASLRRQLRAAVAAQAAPSPAARPPLVVVPENQPSAERAEKRRREQAQRQAQRHSQEVAALQDELAAAQQEAESLSRKARDAERRAAAAQQEGAAARAQGEESAEACRAERRAREAAASDRDRFRADADAATARAEAAEAHAEAQAAAGLESERALHAEQVRPQDVRSFFSFFLFFFFFLKCTSRIAFKIRESGDRVKDTPHLDLARS
jgi:hypothetical protein